MDTEKEFKFLKERIESLEKMLFNHTHQCLDSQAQSSAPIWHEIDKE